MWRILWGTGSLGRMDTHIPASSRLWSACGRCKGKRDTPRGSGHREDGPPVVNLQCDLWMAMLETKMGSWRRCTLLAHLSWRLIVLVYYPQWWELDQGVWALFYEWGCSVKRLWRGICLLSLSLSLFIKSKVCFVWRKYICTILSHPHSPQGTCAIE